MIESKIKRILYQSTNLETYLQYIQTSYFLLYESGILRFNTDYKYHYHVKRFIKRGDTVIDIGANLGYYSFLFAKWVGKNGKVYSVEPVEIYNRIFRKKMKKKTNIVLYSYALGQEEKEIELVTPSPTQTGYFRTGLSHIYNAETDGKVENIEYRFPARMVKPSELFENLKRIDYIKCDAEGFEYDILSEMKDIIAKYKPKIQVEVWPKNYDAMHNLMKSMGYISYKFGRGGELLSDEEMIKKMEGDFIFISEPID